MLLFRDKRMFIYFSSQRKQIVNFLIIVNFLLRHVLEFWRYATEGTERLKITNILLPFSFGGVRTSCFRKKFSLSLVTFGLCSATNVLCCIRHASDTTLFDTIVWWSNRKILVFFACTHLMPFDIFLPKWLSQSACLPVEDWLN